MEQMAGQTTQLGDESPGECGPYYMKLQARSILESVRDLQLSIAVSC